MQQETKEPEPESVSENETTVSETESSQPETMLSETDQFKKEIKNYLQEYYRSRYNIPDCSDFKSKYEFKLCENVVSDNEKRAECLLNVQKNGFLEYAMIVSSILVEKAEQYDKFNRPGRNSAIPGKNTSNAIPMRDSSIYASKCLLISTSTFTFFSPFPA